MIRRALPHLRQALSPSLTVGGFGLLSASAWCLHTAAGLAAAGLSCLVLEWLTNDSPTAPRP